MTEADLTPEQWSEVEETVRERSPGTIKSDTEIKREVVRDLLARLNG